MSRCKYTLVSDIVRRYRKAVRRFQRLMSVKNTVHPFRRRYVLLVKRIRGLAGKLAVLGIRTPRLARGMLLGGLLGAGTICAQTPHISTLAPSTNALHITRDADISITFSTTMNLSTVTGANIRIYSAQSGMLSASGSFSGNPARVFDPAGNFQPGELISVSISTGATATNGSALAKPVVYQFHAAVNGGYGEFAITGFGAGGVSGTAIGDLDGDGDLDAVVVGGSINSRELWLNNGDGSFSSSTFGSSQNCSDIALGDLDGDGDLDAVIAKGNGNAQEIWLNNGNATFTSSTFGAGSSRGIALGDLDGDGDLDAIIANRLNQAQEIWLNNGNGTFTSSSFGGNDTWAVALGDVDNDGDLDAVLGQGGQAEIWLNNGDATFLRNSFGIPDYYRTGVALGDLDGDGNLDAVLVKNNNLTQEIWLGNGDGSFSSSTFGTGENLDVVLGDLDGDGDLDALIAAYDEFDNPPPQVVWLNNGDGSFSSSGYGMHQGSAAALGDFDGDGDLDAIIGGSPDATNIWINMPLPRITALSPGTNATAAPRDANIEITFSRTMDPATLTTATVPTSANLIVYGMQTGHITTRATLSYSNGNTRVVIDPAENFKAGEEMQVTISGAADTSGANIQAAFVYGFRAAVAASGTPVWNTTSFGSGISMDAALGDLDGDGDLDAVIADNFAGQEIWLNNGDGSFSSTTYGSGTAAGIALGDLDGDGDLDALIANESGAQELWLNNGDAGFYLTYAGGGDSRDVALGDLDGDGDLDALIANYGQANTIWLNNGDGSFTSVSFGSSNNGMGVALGDLDGDGDLDALIANYNNPQEIWLNNGDGSFVNSVFGSGSSRDVALGDVDGDGDLDALIANYGLNEIWLNNGDGSFASSTFGSGNTYGLGLGDVDGDGDLDALLANNNAAQEIWLNNGDGSFTSSSFGGGNSSRGLALGDLDGDGDIDALIATYGGAQEIWYNQARPRIAALSPSANASAAPRDAHIEISFSQTMDTATLTTATVPTNANLVVYGMQTGHITTRATLSYTNDNTTVVIDPAENFKPGEEIMLTVTGATAESGLVLERAAVYGFRAAVQGGTGVFASSAFGPENAGAVALGDVDGDGDLDALVCADPAPQLWLNNGDGVFTSSVIGAGEKGDAALGDLDGDGDLDVFIANESGAQEIWLNNGNATFTSSSFAAGNGQDVKLGDLDGDGDLDALIAIFGGGQIIGLNNGDGSFTSTTFGGGNSKALALGDVDGDGDLDALIANLSSAQEIWLNNGDGSFATGTIGSSASVDVALGDVDGDGDLDVLFANYGSQKILLNNGDGTFTSSSFDIGDGVQLALADLDGDSDLDMVIVRFDQAREIWLNRGNGAFTSSSFGDGKGSGVALGDLDGDGDIDGIITNIEQSQEIWLNQPPPRVTALSPSTNATAAPRDTHIAIDFSQAMNPATLTTATLFVHGMETGNIAAGALLTYTNGNTRVAIDPAADFKPGEIIAVSVSTGASNSGGAALAKPFTYRFQAAVHGGTADFQRIAGESGIHKDVAVGDLDGDGDLDAIVVSLYPHAEIWLNDGAAGMSVVPFGSIANQDVALGDLDGDGDLDAVIAKDGAANEIWINNGDATFISSAYGNTLKSLGVALGDLDGDGDLDAIFANSNQPGEIWINNGTGTFNSRGFGTPGAYDVALGDLDCDGDLDALIAITSGQNQLWLNDGAAGFTSSVLALGITCRSVQIGDLDGDGDLDAIFANHNSPSAIVLNNGAAGFTSSAFGTRAGQDVALGDLDGDGDLDAVIARENGAQEIWLNNGDGTFTSTNFGSSGDSRGVALGDLDGDGDLDVISLGFELGLASEIWLNLPQAPLITAITPGSTTASLSALPIALSGTFYEVTTAQLTTLDHSGTPVGSIDLPLAVVSASSASALIPPGYTATAGTLTLTIANLSGSTSTTLSILNDSPLISTNQTVIAIEEDQATTLSVALADVWPGVAGLVVSTPPADMVTIASITQVGSTGAVTQFLVQPVSNAAGTVPLMFTVDDGELTGTTTITLIVVPVNDAPQIAAASAVTGAEDSATTTYITLLDVDTPYSNLILSATSANQSILTDSGIVPGAAGASTAIQLRPATNANGSVQVTVSAFDGEYTRSTTFTYTVNPVNDAPTLAGFADITFQQNDTGSIALQLADIDNTESSLMLSATSSNQSLLPDGNLIFGATSATTELVLMPTCGASGTALITVRVSDGEYTSTGTFSATVQAAGSLAVSGATLVCPAEIQTYTAEPFVTHATYTWAITGGDILAGQGSTALSVRWESHTQAALEVTAHWPNGCSDSTSFPVEINSILARMDYGKTDNNSSVRIDLPANDSGSNLYIDAVDTPRGGTLSIDGDEIVYTPYSTFSGIDIFNYYLAAGGACSATGAVLVAVAPDTEYKANLEYIEAHKNEQAGVQGLSYACAAAGSPDGRHVYVAGQFDNAIALFERDSADGTLTYIERLRNGAGGVAGISLVSALALSPDGKHLYAAGYGNNAVAVFSRNEETGALGYIEKLKQNHTQGSNTITGIKRVIDVALSPDGKNVYAVGYNNHSVAVFERNAENGTLTWLEYHKNGAGGVDGMNKPHGVTVSPDGKNVYIAAYGDNALAVFHRDLATGRLSYGERLRDGVNGVNGLGGAYDVAVSPDATHVYAVGYNEHSLAIFARDTALGTLSYIERLRDGVDGVDGLLNAAALAVSADGANVYVLGYADNALAVFTRKQESGLLEYRESCFDGSAGVDGLNGPRGLFVEGESRHIYVAAYGESAVSAHYRNRAPLAAADANGVGPDNTVVIAALNNDSDPDGHSLTITGKTDGALGTVSISGGGTTLTYSAGSATGADSFTYTVEDGHGASSTATVSVSVALLKQGSEEYAGPGAPAVCTVCDFSLRPNPVQDAATFRFRLPERAEVRLRLLDALGRERIRLYDDELPQGSHSIDWQAAGGELPDGQYRAVLEVRRKDGGKEVQALPVILLQ